MKILNKLTVSILAGWWLVPVTALAHVKWFVDVEAVTKNTETVNFSVFAREILFEYLN